MHLIGIIIFSMCPIIIETAIVQWPSNYWDHDGYRLPFKDSSTSYARSSCTFNFIL